MRRLSLFLIDFVLVLAASVFALMLRENLNVSLDRLAEFLPYLAMTAAMVLALWPAAGLDRSVWRFSSHTDYVRVTAAMAATVVGAAALAFAYNRLDGVARSLPPLQFLTGTAFLTGARAIYRLSHQIRHHRKASPGLLQVAPENRVQTVLIVGISRLAETYLQAIAELAPHSIRVAGFISLADRHAGWLVANYPVLGVPEDLAGILDRLDVHGIEIDRIVVATPLPALSAKARDALFYAGRSRNIAIHVLAESLGLEISGHQPLLDKGSTASEDLRFEISADNLNLIGRRLYWIFKRVMDSLAAFVLLVALCPLLVLITAAVASTLGSPAFFWQQRPGLGGRPFRLYKFRTMKAAHGHDGQLLADSDRVSSLGSFLRRVRLDELLQLFNILRGDMSFVGPRPLLPKDQSSAYNARLLVRPGLTGWAQVVGGRHITPEDKAALDVWYVRHASLALDIGIALRTIPVVLFGERISSALVKEAWRDLSESGVLRGELSQGTKNGLLIARPRI
jgi:lipopolysaccharide/colanic/teichoic acid biosynthesis glycosyltransferase